jgi:hypothetical protein
MGSKPATVSAIAIMQALARVFWFIIFAALARAAAKAEPVPRARSLGFQGIA